MAKYRGDQLSLIAETDDDYRPSGDWYDPDDLGSARNRSATRGKLGSATLPKPELKNLGSVVARPKPEPKNLGSANRADVDRSPTLPKSEPKNLGREATLPKPELKNLGSVDRRPESEPKNLGSANRADVDREKTLPKLEPKNLGSEATLPKPELENLGSVERRPNHLVPKSMPMKVGLIQRKLNTKTGNYYWYWRYYDTKGKYRSIYAGANMYDAIAKVEARGIPADASKKYLKDG
jgi:hypothetical protein